MPVLRMLTGALLALAVGVSTATGVLAADTDTKLRSELERIARLRIFFGHQSVGENVLDGVAQLARTAGVAVKITDTAEAARVAEGSLGHFFVGENRKPVQKLEAFARALGQQPGNIDVAFVKFCFLDIAPETDAKALFERYRSTLADLRARHAGTTFVHVTAPLTTVGSGPKEWLKRILGRAPYGVAENLRREEYNALLRGVYEGREPIFDLARIESTAEDGNVASFEWQGRRVPVLVQAYTDDGHHLNSTGRLRAARTLISVLAAVSERR